MYQSIHRDTSRVVLTQDVPLAKWKGSLQAKLAENNVTGYVFHNIHSIRPVIRPVDTTADGTTDDPTFLETLDAHLRALEVWTLGEISANNIIINQLDLSMCPRSYDQMTAQELYNSIADTRKEAATAPFQAHLQGLDEAAEILQSSTGVEYHVTKGQAAAIFVLGTKHVPWLSTWRDLRALNDNNGYTSLETMMSTLRVVDGHRAHQTPPHNPAMAAHETSDTNPNDDCKLCKHHHRNKEYYKQHPELAVGSKGERYWSRKAKGIKKGKANAVSNLETDDDSDSDVDGAIVATASISNLRLTIYDTGASHHFIPSESVIVMSLRRTGCWPLKMSLRYTGGEPMVRTDIV
ncbi:hypothetical protein K3495_g4727 [Podosphaera aphanis]|nr:hypothetical protein K3495_g4727 [Podosphaera aphanis]